MVCITTYILSRKLAQESCSLGEVAFIVLNGALLSQQYTFPINMSPDTCLWRCHSRHVQLVCEAQDCRRVSRLPAIVSLESLLEPPPALSLACLVVLGPHPRLKAILVLQDACFQVALFSGFR